MAAALEERVVKKIKWRLLPLLMILYFVAYLDRVNIGFASLRMNADLGLSSQVFGLGAGIFFLGYFLFEIPSNLILYRVGAKRWIARIMVTWGIVSMGMAFVQGPISFYVMRFLLGLAEAGFFPGVIMLLSQWFPGHHRARMIALFMAAVPLSVALGSPISGAIMELDGAWGLKGWQWLFLVEGVPAVLLAPVVLIWLDDGPRSARWLAPAEAEWLELELARTDPPKVHGFGTALKALADWRLALLAFVYFGTSAGLYALGIWSPQVIAQFGLDPLETGLINAVPAMVAVVGMLAWARHSDLVGEREWHVVIACLVAAAGLLLAGTAATLITCVSALCLVNVGISSAKPPLWAIPSRFLGGAKAAVGIAVINAIGNLGGFVGPTLIGWLRDRTGSFAGGLMAVAAMLAISAILLTLMALSRSLRPRHGSSA